VLAPFIFRSLGSNRHQSF